MVLAIFFVVGVVGLQLVLSQDTGACLNVNSGDDVSSLVQMEAPVKPAAVHDMDADFASQWRSPRDLASIDSPVNISLASDVAFIIYSAVPVFGDDANYVALLTDSAHDPDTFWFAKKRKDRPWKHMAENPIYCRGAGGRNQVQIKGRSLLCPWPSEDSEKTSIKVILEDEVGKTLGSVLAKQVPRLLKNYNAIACVRDIFDEPNPALQEQGNFSAPFKQLVEWVEFHSMSGVDHFLFYTFKGAETEVLEVMRPYVENGVATRVHFDFYPWEQMVRQGFMANDCLFRAKNHAKWLMPTIDVDEYISPRFAHSNDPKKTLRNYFNGLFESILEKNNKERNHVSELRFARHRFARSPPDELEISSFQKEPRARYLAKSVINTDVCYDVSVHHVEFHDAGTHSFKVPESEAIIHHYRFDKTRRADYEDQVDMEDPMATDTDTSFKPLVPMLQRSLEDRFRLRSAKQLKNFVREMSQKHPTSSQKLKKFDPWNP